MKSKFQSTGHDKMSDQSKTDNISQSKNSIFNSINFDTNFIQKQQISSIIGDYEEEKEGYEEPQEMPMLKLNIERDRYKKDIILNKVKSSTKYQKIQIYDRVTASKEYPESFGSNKFS